jgi:hypothetical protein
MPTITTRFFVNGFHGVAVQAFSTEDVDVYSITGAAGFYAGIAGSVTVDILESDSKAYIGTGADINDPLEQTRRNLLAWRPAMMSELRVWMVRWASVLPELVEALTLAFCVTISRHISALPQMFMQRTMLM